MNSPHVEALIYVVDHDDAIKYQGRSESDHWGFRMKIENDLARFEMKEHYATVQEARNAVQSFIERWEFQETLRVGPGQFALRFEKPEVIDRRPDPGAVTASPNPVNLSFTLSKPTVTVTRPYPQPPSEGRINLYDPDVKVMHFRYLLYRQGGDLLASTAYFCCDVFTKRLSRDFTDAASKHKISHNLIKKVHSLSSNKGGNQGRHAHGVDHPLTRDEEIFLENSVVAMIIRAAKVAADPNQHMDEINVGNLRHISP